MPHPKLFSVLRALLGIIALAIAVSTVWAQDPGDCGPIQENGECKKLDGTVCKTSKNVAGTCKSTKAGTTRFTCQCIPNPPPQPPRKKGGTGITIITFAGLMLIWIVYRQFRRRQVRER
jgi:hypothetical protein